MCVSRKRRRKEKRVRKWSRRKGKSRIGGEGREKKGEVGRRERKDEKQRTASRL